MSITINGATNTVSASGTVTVPALTLAGAITGGGQNVSGLGTLACGNTAVTGTLSATGNTSVTDTTDATSTTAASLKTAGGLAVAKKAYFGDAIDVGTSSGVNATLSSAVLSAFRMYSSSEALDQKYWSLQMGSGIGAGVLRLRLLDDALTTGINAFTITRTGISSCATVWGPNTSSPFTTNGITTVSLTQDASSTTSAALVVSGGVGIAKKLYVGDNIVMASGKGIEGGEGTAPAAPSANRFIIFAEDNGAGKTRLMVQFATGAAQQLAIEP